MAYLGNSPGVASQRVVTQFTATSGQTTFTPQSGYTIGYLDVFLNGVKLVNGDDYTASDGVSITLISAASLGDSVELVSFTPRGLSDGWLKSEADSRYLQLNASFSGDVTGTYNAITLANSGATAGTYGSSSAVPQITVDAKGRITSVSSVDISSLGDTVISSSGTSAALRITQTGTGNALLVEDSANPDSTPFVVDASGNVGIGGSPLTSGLSIVATTAYAPQVLMRAKSSDANSGYFFFQKDRAGAIVQAGDNVGVFQFSGFDGSAYTAVATIAAGVDGTPGTNDMPGRLVFSTTADGASSPTERMRIDSAGNVGIGGAASAGNTLVSYKAMTGGGGYVYAFNNVATVNSDATVEAVSFQSYLSTQAASFTAANLRHFKAYQSTIGAGSTVTNQVGYFAHASLTGATNNYGFYSDIASGTGRWNFFANGTANNYFNGNVGIGTSSPSYKLDIYGGSLGTTAGNQIIAQQLRVVTANDDKLEFSKIRISNGADWTTAGWRLQQKVDVTWHGYIQFNGNNNEGISFGTGGSTVSANSITERMRISDFGNVGIGTSSLTGWSLRISKNITGGTSGFGVGSDGSIQSGVTSAARMFISQPSTAAASFTLPILDHYLAVQGTIGAGSTVTNQYGFSASSNLTGATNNYGFYSDIASGTGRYNFYANGTADNYFAGRVGIGTTPESDTKVVVGGTLPSNASSSKAYTASFFVPSSSTSTAYGFLTYVNTSATAFTLSNLYHYQALQGTVGAGSAITNQFGFLVSSTLTGATNNYGFYSDIASGTGRWNFYAAGTARNYFAGRLSLGDATDVGAGIFANYSISGSGGIGYGIKQHNTVTSSVTSNYIQYQSSLYTQAAAFTLTAYRHYSAEQGVVGAGSTVSNQYGFIAESNLTGATNNYAFFSNIASGTGRWNFYAGGTADNYFAGNVLIGTTTNTNSSKMVVAGTVELTSGSIRFSDGTTQTTAASASSAKNYWLYESTFLI